jgi:hypothetical protein
MEKAKQPGGCTCHSCGQHVQIYKRGITSAMAKNLVDLIIASKANNGYVHYKMIQNSHDMAKLEYWGLIMRKPRSENDPESKKSSGYWKPTTKGIWFAKGRIKVPSKCFVYNNAPQGFSVEECVIQDCVKNKFNYKELMEGA